MKQPKFRREKDGEMMRDGGRENTGERRTFRGLISYLSSIEGAPGKKKSSEGDARERHNTTRRMVLSSDEGPVVYRGKRRIGREEISLPRAGQRKLISCCLTGQRKLKYRGRGPRESLRGREKTGGCNRGWAEFGRASFYKEIGETLKYRRRLEFAM